MNKRLGVLVGVVLVGAIAGFYLFSAKQAGDEASYSDYLPGDTLATMRLTHVNQISDSFAKSPLGRLLGKESMAAIFTELHAEEEAVLTYNRFHDTLVELTGNPAFRTVFGDDTTLALLKPHVQQLEENAQQELERTMVAFATTAATGALDMFAGLLESEQVSREEVQGYTMTKVQVDGKNEIYGFAGNGIVLLSYNPDTIAACLNVRAQGESLRGAAAFQQAEQYWNSQKGKTVYSKFFVNIGVLQELFEASVNEQGKAVAEMLEGISFLASVTSGQGNDIYSDSTAGFAYEQLHPMIKEAINTQSVTNTTLHLLGEKCLVYNWASSLSPEFMRYSLADSDVAGLEEVLQRELGVSLEELLNTVGPQYGFVINDIVNTGFLPVPKLIFFSQIRNHEAALSILTAIREKINGRGLVAEQQLTVGEHIIYYWPVMPGEATQLGMVLTPTMLYIANGTSVLADIVEHKNGSGLSAQVVEDLGGALEKEVGTAGMGAAVIYPARMAKELQGVAQWIFTTMAATQDVSVSTLGRGILEIMRAYEVIVVTSNLSRENGSWQATIREKEKEERK